MRQLRMEVNHLITLAWCWRSPDYAYDYLTIILTRRLRYQRWEPGIRNNIDIGGMRWPSTLDHQAFCPRPGVPGRLVKKFADFRVVHRGLDLLLDHRFTWDLPSTLECCIEVGGSARLAEQAKLREYTVGLSFPPALFLPLSVDAFGPSLRKYLDEIFCDYKLRAFSDSRRLHYAETCISMAVCRAANHMYLDRLRFGRRQRRPSSSGDAGSTQVPASVWFVWWNLGTRFCCCC
jgi:hypothetical protein